MQVGAMWDPLNGKRLSRKPKKKKKKNPRKQWKEIKRKDKQEKENNLVTSFNAPDPAVPEATPGLLICLDQYIYFLLQVNLC